jgi:hypothetical protein
MTCTAVAPEPWSSAASTYGTRGTLRPRGRLERATQVAAFSRTTWSAPRPRAQNHLRTVTVRLIYHQLIYY